MAVEVHVRRLKYSWQYDFKVPGQTRVRKGGYRTRQAALTAGRDHMAKLEMGVTEITLDDAFKQYMAATKMKDRSRDTYHHHWKLVVPVLGHRLIDEIDTSMLDAFKQTLPTKFSAGTVNHHLILIRAVLRFMWKRGKLRFVPYVPMEKKVLKHQDWYTTEERDRLLDGMFRLQPRWYLFFYLTCRLGLRRGEVYAISHRQIRHIPPQLIVDQQVQRGNKKRAAMLIPRKNNEAFTLSLSQDVLDAMRWHIDEGYAGDVYLFVEGTEFPRYVDSYMRPLKTVQEKLGLRPLGHHAIGRHSVASQAATGGESIKAIQAQLGHRSEQSTHKYAHLGSSAQLHVVESLAPQSPPHLLKKCP